MNFKVSESKTTESVMLFLALIYNALKRIIKLFFMSSPRVSRSIVSCMIGQRRFFAYVDSLNKNQFVFARLFCDVEIVCADIF